MGHLRILMFAGLGILVAIVALPQTRWIAQNHVSYMLGKGPMDLYYGRLDPANWPGETAADQLAKALQSESIIWNRDSGKDELQLLKVYCNTHPNDAAGWAHLARLATKAPMRIPGAQKKEIPRAFLEKRDRYEALLELATQNGERLEPQNLYFTLLRAALYESKGRHKEAQALVLAAQNKTAFNDHLSEEGDLIFRTASRGGYRGSAMELAIFAGLILPHVASLSHVLPFIPKDEMGQSVPEVQLALIREAHTAAKGANNLITVIVMKGVVHKVLAGRTSPKMTKVLGEFEARAKELDLKLNTGESQRILADFNKVRTNYFAADHYPDKLYEEGIAQSILVCVIFVALILAVPLLYAAKGISNFKLRISRKADSVKERSTLWTLWAFLMILSSSAVITGFLKPGSPQGLLTMFGISDFGPALINGGELVAIGGLVLVLCVIFIPRRHPKLGTAIALAYAVLPLLYLATVLKTLQVDQNIKQVVKTFRTDVDRFRGNWSN
jgi:hypothetical protein